MYIHHLRNATFIIESEHTFILVDPMLGPKGSGRPFTFFRFPPKRNPLSALPANSEELLSKVTHCLITHLHPDHLDPAAVAYLKSNNIPCVCSELDRHVLERKGLTIELSLDYWSPRSYLKGKLIGTPAIHGYGFVKKIAGKVMGYYLELPMEKSIYLSSDTVYTRDVDRVLQELKPDLSIVAAGIAQLDLGQPLLMHKADLIRFVKNAPGQVMANHMEALNHCPHTRDEFKALLEKEGLIEKVTIPEDGETVAF